MGTTGALLVPHDYASAAAVRHRLCEELRAVGLSSAVLDDAVIIAGELVGNALRHARPLPDGGVRVMWDVDGDGILMQVTDGGADTEPRLQRRRASPGARPVAGMALGGRGLAIVESLADAWGVRRQPGGTTVWARLSLRHRGSRLAG